MGRPVCLPMSKQPRTNLKHLLTKKQKLPIDRFHAGVVKLVDAEDSKSSGLWPVRVRFSPPAPEK